MLVSPTTACLTAVCAKPTSVLPARMLKSMSGSGSMSSARLDLSDQLEEEAQLADFDRLFHDVHAVQVVDDDGLEDEVAAVGMRGDLGQRRPEVRELSSDVARRQRRWLVDERLHPVQAGLVERFEDVERGEQERAGAAGGVEDGDALEWRW